MQGNRWRLLPSISPKGSWIGFELHRGPRPRCQQQKMGLAAAFSPVPSLVGFQAAVPLTERGFSPAPAQPDQPFLPLPSLQVPLCLPDAHHHLSLLPRLGDKSKQLSFIDTVMKPVITQKKFANKINQSSNGNEWGASFYSEICTRLVA